MNLAQLHPRVAPLSCRCEESKKFRRPSYVIDLHRSSIQDCPGDRQDRFQKSTERKAKSTGPCSRSGSRHGARHVVTTSPSRSGRGKRVRDRSQGHCGTIRRGQRDVAAGRREIKIEITSRAQGGACQWLDSVGDAIRNSSPRERPRLAGVASADSHGRRRRPRARSPRPGTPSPMNRAICLTRKRVVERVLRDPVSAAGRRGSPASPFFSFC